MYLALDALLLGMSLSLAQTPLSKQPPEFEVASIKLNTSGSGAGSIDTTPGRLTVQNFPLNRCIQTAFDVYDDALFSGPAWLNSERFDIEAKASGPATHQELMQMFQALLAKRFQMTFHTETRSMAVFVLVPAKGGLKLQRPDPNDPSSGQTMAHFAAQLSNMRGLNLGRPVIDMTGFEGEFKRNLPFKSDTTDSLELQARLTSVLAEQLGLKLESRKANVGVMVVDRLEKLPTAN
jgi:uncharacterized protein (TIGR03435 family)